MVYDPDRDESKQAWPTKPRRLPRSNARGTYSDEQRKRYVDGVLDYGNDKRGMSDEERLEFENEAAAGKHGEWARKFYGRKIAGEEGGTEPGEAIEQKKSDTPTVGELAVEALQQIITLKIGPTPENAPMPTDADAPVSATDAPAGVRSTGTQGKGQKSNLAPATASTDEITGGPVPEDPDSLNLWDGEAVK
jgi:hypothetical protein